MTLTWGGRGGVANKRPAQPDRPGRPRVRRGAATTRRSRARTDAGIEVLLTIVGTPAWANGGQGARARAELGDDAPRSSPTRRRVATAARSSTRRAAGSSRGSGMWLAWNEPNNPVFLQPQFARVSGKWTMAAPAAYAQICNAVYSGVHAAGGPERSPAGRRRRAATTTRRARAPRSRRSRSCARPRTDGPPHVRRLGAPPVLRQPVRDARDAATVGSRAVGLGNIDALISEVTRLYGRKPLWITEYGYQTKPPDDFFGVTWREAGGLPPPGVRDREGEPAHRPLHVVPARGQPGSRRLAVGADHDGRPQEARIRSVRRPARSLALIQLPVRAAAIALHCVRRVPDQEVVVWS